MQVNHLLRRGPLGLLPFHSSLLVFMRSTEDYGTQQNALGAAVVQWLEDGAPAYWRWAYEWTCVPDLVRSFHSEMAQTERGFLNLLRCGARWRQPRDSWRGAARLL